MYRIVKLSFENKSLTQVLFITIFYLFSFFLRKKNAFQKKIFESFQLCFHIIFQISCIKVSLILVCNTIHPFTILYPFLCFIFTTYFGFSLFTIWDNLFRGQFNSINKISWFFFYTFSFSSLYSLIRFLILLLSLYFPPFVSFFMLF